MWGLFEAAQAVHADQQQQHRTIHPGDCSACGSQEFRRWQGKSVCAYCRSVASPSVATVEDSKRLANPHPAWGGRYQDPLSIARPHAHARLAID